MKKIAVVGLYAIKNAGDNILCEATQYLIRQHMPEAQIVEVDVNPRAKSYRKLEKIPFLISKVLIKMSGYMFSYENHSRFRYIYEYFMWWLKINHKFKKQLKDVDAIVFAGGGFLKFRTQGLNYYVEQIVKIAEKNHIPIMMNGVGIEGYDEKDIRCQRLKKAINNDCMKVITTRDDIDTLQNLYIANPNIKTSRVGDPALWVPECYDVANTILGGDMGRTAQEEADLGDSVLEDTDLVSSILEDGVVENDETETSDVESAVPADSDEGGAVLDDIDDMDRDLRKKSDLPENAEDRPLIGVNVIRGRVYQAYGNSLSEFQLLNFYKKLITGIEERGWDWVLFSNGMAADQKFGRQLLRALGYKKSRKLWRAPVNTRQFLRQITRFDCVFGARLHACITSYALDIPVVGLIWSEKLQIFSEVIGKKESFFTEDNLRIEQILDAIQNAMDTGYDASIREHLRELTDDYLGQFLQMLGE